MEKETATWQGRFGLTTCAATDVERAIPAEALGVAVIYVESTGSEKIFLVIESRAGSLRGQCVRRLQTAKLTAGTPLLVAFKADSLPDGSPEAVHAACREQVICAGELRRELRPAMR
jgi:hypothetical protein